MKTRIAVAAATASAAAAGAAMLVTGLAVAGGVTATDLQARGWFCLPPPATPENVHHCFTPGQNTTALNVLVFDASGTRLLGTEHLIRADRYNDQPCQGTPDGRYAFVPLGPGYFACHHFDLGG